MVMVNEDDVAAAVKAAALANQERDSIDLTEDRTATPGESNVVAVKKDSDSDECIKSSRSGSVFEGLLLTSCAARGPADYVKFMTRFQVSIYVFSGFKFIFILLLFLFFSICFLNRVLVPLSPYQLFAPIQLNRRIRKYVFYDLNFYV